MAIIAECLVCHRKQSLRKKTCSCDANMDKEKENKKVRYHIVYRDNGKQKWRSVGSFKGLDSRSIEDARDADARFRVTKKQNEIEIFDPKPEANMTFDEMSQRYLDLEKVKAQSSYKTVKTYLDKFNVAFGKIKVNHIKAVDLENHQHKRLKEGLKPTGTESFIIMFNFHGNTRLSGIGSMSLSPALNTCFFICTDNKLILFKRFVFPNPVIEIENSPGFSGKIRISG